MREARKLAENVWQLPRSDGPSEAFVRLTRNPKLASPKRFERSEQVREDDIWL
jgi:hypothetical protein